MAELAHSKRYLGLELSGAKNHKTVVAALEYYPKEKKTFLLDIYDRISTREKQGADEALLELLEELRPGVARLAVNVPLGLPPCLLCNTKSCAAGKCPNPATRWMRAYARKVARSAERPKRVLEFTPYTMRPVELWIRHHVMEELPDAYRFEVDEALGGNKAPLTARMQFLKRHLAHPSKMHLIEAWPKLSVATLGVQLGLSKRVIGSYRHLEQGAHAREEILEALIRQRGIFIYERDVHKLGTNLGAFDAFICAYTAMLADLNQCASPPSGFPLSSGWVHYPC